MSMLKKVLLVEDYDDLRFLMTDIISDAGYEVTAFSDGPQVLNTYQPGQYDAIVMDTQLISRQLGYEICAELRKIDQKVIIIGMSSDPDYRANWMEAGANTFYHKRRPQDIEGIIKLCLGDNFGRQ